MSVMVAQTTNSTVTSLPRDGMGAVTIAYATDHLTSGSEVYTATTCTATWPVGGEPNTGTAVGDLVATADGYWGVFVSGTATVVTVDKWRYKDGSVGTPAAGSDCRIYNGKCILSGARETFLHRIVFSNAAAGTVIITDPFGNALTTFTLAATPLGNTLEFAAGPNDNGLRFNTAIGFRTSVTTITATYVFRS